LYAANDGGVAAHPDTMGIASFTEVRSFQSRLGKLFPKVEDEPTMSAVAVNTTLAQGIRFYQSTLGKKVVMAVTGIIGIGFLIAHMAANLQFFLGRESINAYAAGLREVPALLWSARLTLIVAIVLHIVASVQLTSLQKAARPVKYVRKKNADSSYASRTMMWSGPILAAFVVYHLMHLTWGTVHPRFEHLQAYENLIYGFSNPVVVVFYLIAMAMLLLHLYHGAWSMFQTMGASHPRYTPKLKAFAKLLAIVLFVGFSSVPIAVLAGVRP
jgi:succinate dehydrogenase / fumarate reductase cytochrome b subunit